MRSRQRVKASIRARYLGIVSIPQMLAIIIINIIGLCWPKSHEVGIPHLLPDEENEAEEVN